MTQPEVTFFDFESDFVEENMKCIPMIVRYKLDASGIKLKLSEWSKMTKTEREALATMPTETGKDCLAYRTSLANLIKVKTGNDAMMLSADAIDRSWADTGTVPGNLAKKVEAMNVVISVDKWSKLTILQRFALCKLAGSNHESKNLVRALREFALI